MTALYFAYGSNLVLDRLRERVHVVDALGAARLDGHRLVCDKAGRDGSAKANLVVDPGDHVWGALYRLEAQRMQRLDRFEGGYQRCEVRVEARGEVHRALTYRSERRTADPVPFDWYRQLILEGARDHGLPADWLVRLEALPCRPDPARAVASRLREETP